MDEMADEDCGDSSGDEDGRERYRTSAPTKMPPEDEWEECVIAVDAREAAGVQSRRVGLRGTLDTTDPVLTLFFWFFPLQLFLSHVEELD